MSMDLNSITNLNEYFASWQEGGVFMKNFEHFRNVRSDPSWRNQKTLFERNVRAYFLSAFGFAIHMYDVDMDWPVPTEGNFLNHGRTLLQACFDDMQRLYNGTASVIGEPNAAKYKAKNFYRALLYMFYNLKLLPTDVHNTQIANFILAVEFAHLYGNDLAATTALSFDGLTDRQRQTLPPHFLNTCIGCVLTLSGGLFTYGAEFTVRIMAHECLHIVLMVAKRGYYALQNHHDDDWFRFGDLLHQISGMPVDVMVNPQTGGVSANRQNYPYARTILQERRYFQSMTPPSLYVYFVFSDYVTNIVKKTSTNRSPQLVHEYYCYSTSCQCHHKYDTKMQKEIKIVPFEKVNTARDYAWMDAQSNLYQPFQINAFVQMQMEGKVISYLGTSIYELDNGKIITLYRFDTGILNIFLMKIQKGVFDVKSTNGDIFDGKNFDHVLVNLVAEFKRDFRAIQADINLPYITVDASGPMHMNIKMTRAKFEQLTADLIKRTVEPYMLALAIHDAKMESLDSREILMSRMSNVFSTKTEGQTQLGINLFQDECEMAAVNKLFGPFLLVEGVPQIEVTFVIDANGILNMLARDSGNGQQIVIQVSEAEHHAIENAEEKETIEAINHDESVLHDTETKIIEQAGQLNAEMANVVNEKMETLRPKLGSCKVQTAQEVRDAVNDLQEKSPKLFEAA